MAIAIDDDYGMGIEYFPDDDVLAKLRSMAKAYMKTPQGQGMTETEAIGAFFDDFVSEAVLDWLRRFK